MTGGPILAACFAVALGAWGFRLSIRGQAWRAFSSVSAGTLVAVFLLLSGSGAETADRYADFLNFAYIPAVIGLACGAAIGLIWRRKGPDA